MFEHNTPQPAHNQLSKWRSRICVGALIATACVSMPEHALAQSVPQETATATTTPLNTPTSEEQVTMKRLQVDGSIDITTLKAAGIINILVNFNWREFELTNTKGRAKMARL